MWQTLSGLVAQSCNTATGGQELWDGLRQEKSQHICKMGFQGRNMTTPA